MYPSRSFCAAMIHRIRDKTLKAKYGANGDSADLRDLFKKGNDIVRLGGIFNIIPDEHLTVGTIHFQTKLMAEYAQVYGDFKMADGTFKITKHDKVYVFWIVVDSLLCTRFVGVTVNFTKKSDAIIEGAKVFFKHEFVHEDKLEVGGIVGYYDPYVDNAIDMPTTTRDDCAVGITSSEHSGIAIDNIDDTVPVPAPHIESDETNRSIHNSGITSSEHSGIAIDNNDSQY